MLLSPAPPPPRSPLPPPPPPSLLRESDRSVFSFYCLVRSGAPVWRLEEAREQEARVWDGGRGLFVPLPPSQALVYALVHDRTDYCRALLRRYGNQALSPAPCSFCTRSVGPIHLRLAVRYDRQEALKLILETVQSSLSPGASRSYLDALPLCSHSDAEGAESAVSLAVSSSRPRCLLLLLSAGAAATGLEAGLRRLEAEPGDDALRCVYFLLLFGHAPGPRPLEAGLRHLLGTPLSHWLSGQAPPTLLLQALRAMAKTRPKVIEELPSVLLQY